MRHMMAAIEGVLRLSVMAIQHCGCIISMEN
jgi:hypothetical protein